MSIANILTRLAGKIQKVYDAGHSGGYSLGYDEGNVEGFEAGVQVGYSEGRTQASEESYELGLKNGTAQGKKSAYDEFWDSYQNNGNRTDYRYGFAGSGWTKTTIKPKHKIAPTSIVQMFDRNIVMTKISDLGVEVDFSNVTDVANAFCFTSNLQEIEVPMTLIGSSSHWYQTFYYCTKLKSIKKLTVSSGQFYDNTFTACSSLENIVFEGVIGNSLNMKDSPLSKESIESVVGCLSSTATGKTLTLKKSAKEATFTDEEWATLTANKTNWTINLI